MHILYVLFIGLVTGALAKLIMPGRDPGGMLHHHSSASPGALIAGFPRTIARAGTGSAGKPDSSPRHRRDPPARRIPLPRRARRNPRLNDRSTEHPELTHADLVSLVASARCYGVAHVASSIVIPFLLALALATAFQPIAQRIARRGWPPIVSAVVSAAGILALVSSVGVIVYLAAADVASSLPQYADRLLALQAQLAGWLDGRSMSGAAKSVRAYDVAGPLADLAQSSILSIGAISRRCSSSRDHHVHPLEARHYRRKLIKTFEARLRFAA